MLAQDIRMTDYDYPLPQERIARYPLPCRDTSKLLVYRHGQLSTDTFVNLPHYLPKGALMVFNNTRVIQARLHFRKATGALIEVFLLEPFQPADYEQVFQTTSRCSWLCLVGNLKKWKEGVLSRTVTVGKQTVEVSARLIGPHATSQLVGLSWHVATNPSATTVPGAFAATPPSATTVPGGFAATPPSATTVPGGFAAGSPTPSFAELLEAMGELPIPPYLNRATEQSDTTTYQTVYSKIKGSVAAPTAGLHFTERVLTAIDERAISREELTLHVGAGTFRPVKSETIAGHAMHTETIAVRRHTIAQLIAHQAQAIAVGTTSVRTLESLYWLGLRVMANPDMADEQPHIDQWEPYGHDNTVPSGSPAAPPSASTVPGGFAAGSPTAIEALQALLNWMDRRAMDTLHASTQIIIVPGYEFKIVKMLVTNFHQPQSTLLLLVSAFVKGDWHKIYDYALANDFRFLSYGDSSLLIP